MKRIAELILLAALLPVALAIFVVSLVAVPADEWNKLNDSLP